MSSRWRRWGIPGILALAFASSVVGIFNRFTYDDRYIIELNPAIHTLHRWWRAFATSYWPKEWGGDGYRPLTMLAYRVESAIGGGRPMFFHATNIALYMCVAVLVYVVARRILPEWAAWITAALFAVHPVHVEAVAGVVGQAELLVALAVLLALDLYLRDRLRGELRVRTALEIALLYALGCLGKEHGIVLPAILLVAEQTVIDDRRPLHRRVRELRPFYLALTAVALAFVGVRSAVLADHGLGGFQPFMPFSMLRISAFHRALTALGVVPEWIRLLYWPAHLASEYGPPDIQIAQGLGLWQLPGVLLLVAILGLGHLLRRRQPVIAFGIAFVCIVLLPSSNFILPAGIVLAERTLFLPSVGAMLVAGGLLVAAVERLRTAQRLTPTMVRAGAALAAVVLITGAGRSWQRTLVWKDNETLFKQAVIDAPMTYRAHYMLGAWDFENKRKRLGEAEYHRAMELFPFDPFLSYNLAEQYRKVGLCAPALPLYRWTHDLDPGFALGHSGYAWCLLNEEQYDAARKEALSAIRAGSDLPAMRRVLFTADSAKAVLDFESRNSRASSTDPSLHTPSGGVSVRRASKLPDSVQKAGPRHDAAAGS